MNIDPIFQPFLGTDVNSKWMQQINEQKGYCYATNANLLIRVPTGLTDGAYPAHEKTANFDSLFERLTFHEPIVFSNTALLECLQHFTKVPQRIECDECGGDGNKYCDMGHLHSCDECNGEGYNENRANLFYPAGEETFVKMCGSYFSPYYLSILFNTVEGLHKDKFALIASKDQPLKAKVFVIGDFEVLIMPCNWENVDDRENAQVVDLTPEL